MGGFFSWIIAPGLVALLMTRDLLQVLGEASASTLFWTYFFGCLWGVGGLTFGLTMRYLGISLGMAVALGYCAAFGTLMPPIFNAIFSPHGTPLSQVFGTTSGVVILIGVGVCLAGIALSGMAGVTKEKQMSETEKKAVIKEFSFKKGMLVGSFSGVVSASFSYGLAAGEPIKELTLKHGTAPLWQGLPVLVVILLGGFTTNFIWCVFLNLRNHTGGQYFTANAQESPQDPYPIIEATTDAPGEEMARNAPLSSTERAQVSLALNYLLLRHRRRGVVPPVFLLHHGRKSDGPIQVLQLDAAHGEHHHFQHALGPGASRVEGREPARDDVPRLKPRRARRLHSDHRLRKLPRGFQTLTLTLIMRTNSYPFSQEAYAEWGVDTEAALKRLATIPLSLPCWQGDDVQGFEKEVAALTSGGIQATGHYPGKARTINELRRDLDTTFSLIPGRHRLNLHASYADLNGRKVERNALATEHFQGWIDWSRERGLGLDFNPTFFSHPLANDGWTLSHIDSGVRQFWIEHGIACRKIGGEMGRQLGTPTVTNVWIPDGSKDVVVDRSGPRQRLETSLDTIFKEEVDSRFHLDALESKLFGIGSESYVVGSHEFYLGYAVKRQKLLCLDAGHFHPTESLADKISSVLLHVPQILLHLSRGVRWDSDHVVILDDSTKAIMEELVRGEFLERTHIGLDYFDASINRVAAWVIGARNAIKALLLALLEPTAKLREMEAAGDHTSRLALLEEIKTLPFGEVWNEYLRRQDVPDGVHWLAELKKYESQVLAERV